ncbi:Imm9 family immunity protein [Bacteroides cellulosilyticus]|uniref:Imm9 family immunity protein n=1 Tax=Bacteroides cellulosilyticus TaxID=246787 RepID=UPI0032EC6CA0
MKPKNDIQVLFSIEIPQMDEYVEIGSIRKELNNYAKTNFINLNTEDLADWSVLIKILFQRTDAIGIAKRTARYPSDKEVGIYIAIPIPDNDQVKYGLSVVKEAVLKITNPKYSYDFLPKFSNYDDLDSYILESSRKAIDFAFTKGFTCNGKKIKYQNKIS